MCYPKPLHVTIGAPVVCRDFAPNVDQDLINRSSDLVSRFRLLCMCSGDAVSSLCVTLGLSDRALSQLALSYMGILIVAGVRFDVSGEASAHRRAQPGRLGDMYLDCVHSARISRSYAGDRVTASPNSLVLLDCGICLFVLKL